MKKYVLPALLATWMIIMAVPAIAGEKPALVSTHGDWNVYSFKEDGKKVCFMSTQPYKKEGKYTKRGEVFVFITRWSNGEDKNVVSISNGYVFKPGSTVSVKVDGRVYQMFTQGEMAWTKDHKQDDELTDGIRKGSRIEVEGVSKFGTHTKDTYSLKGSADAHRAMMSACE